MTFYNTSNIARFSKPLKKLKLPKNTHLNCFRPVIRFWVALFPLFISSGNAAATTAMSGLLSGVFEKVKILDGQNSNQIISIGNCHILFLKTFLKA